MHLFKQIYKDTHLQTAHLQELSNIERIKTNENLTPLVEKTSRNTQNVLPKAYSTKIPPSVSSTPPLYYNFNEHYKPPSQLKLQKYQ